MHITAFMAGCLCNCIKNQLVWDSTALVSLVLSIIQICHRLHNVLVPVVCQNVAGTWSHVNSETSDTDFCLKEMGPCLFLFTQPCTECNNTIIPYYIKLIWIPLIASTHILPRPPPYAEPSTDKRLFGGFLSKWVDVPLHWAALITVTNANDFYQKAAYWIQV